MEVKSRLIDIKKTLQEINFSAFFHASGKTAAKKDENNYHHDFSQ
jgi:hypothetical protein